MPLILAFRRLKQECYFEFELSLSYIVKITQTTEILSKIKPKLSKKTELNQLTTTTKNL